jgi:hypothetical protein
MEVLQLHSFPIQEPASRREYQYVGAMTRFEQNRVSVF